MTRAPTHGSATTTEAARVQTDRFPWLAATASMALVTCVHAFTLTRFPAPFVDESWAAARAWFFKSHHFPFSTLDAGVFDRLPGYTTFFPYIPTALHSLAYVGTRVPTLLPLRIESLVLGIVLLGAVFSIARILHGNAAGVAAVLLVGMSSPFFCSAHLARYDIIAAVLGYVAVALYIGNRRQSSFSSFFSGLFACLAFEAHANGVVIGAAFPALFLLDHGKQILRQRVFWTFVLGCLAGVAVYLWLHVLRYPHGFAEFNRIAFAPTHTPPLLTGDFGIMLASLAEFVRSLYSSTMNMVGLAAVAVAVLVVRRSAADVRLLALSLSIMLAFALAVRNKQFYYAVLFWPCIGLMLAALCAAAIAQARTRALNTILAVAVVGACALGSWTNLPRFSGDLFVDHREIMSSVAALVRPGETIMAKQNYWLALRDHVYYSYEGLKYYQRYAKEASIERAFEAFRPDIFVFDSILAQRVTDTPAPDLYSQYLNLPKTELMSLFAKRGRVIGRFDSPLYGAVVVIRMRWDDLQHITATPAVRTTEDWVTR